MEFTHIVAVVSDGHVPGLVRAIPVAVAVAVVLMLSGCAAMTLPAKPETTVQELAKRGYVAERQYATAAFREVWQHGDTALDVSLVAPSDPGFFPLIVYLPGLGESAVGGMLWHKAWAEAGYAVLTVQPTILGESILTSSRARTGDFKALAKEQFSKASLETRLKAVEYALEELKQRTAAGLAPYSKIDTRRVAIAGFDLGAQTVSVLAGEKSGVADVTLGELDFRAAITLSPYVDLAAGGLEQRFAAMSMPVLAITGTEDADPSGVVSSPSLRRAPWQYMPAGDKYLLLLEDGSHALLAGSGLAGKEDSARTEGQAEPSGGRKERRPKGGGQRPSSKNPNRSEARQNGNPRAFNAQHIASVQGVSTAFLDATVKGDPIAREWLARDAARWLADSAKLQVK